jgi:hypothetical protein
MLQHLIDTGNTNVRIRYSTNLSTIEYKRKSIVDYWKHFSRVEAFVSLDSWADRGEYIREGTDWPLLENNIRYIREHAPHIKLEIASVISVFNVYTLPEFLNYIYDNNLFDRTISRPSFYNLINPHYYSYSILNDDLKNKIIEKLSAVSYSPAIDNQINNVLSHLKNSIYNEELKNEFLNVTDHYDEIRNRHFVKTFPELAELYS